jgi:hypothetical protein
MEYEVMNPYSFSDFLAASPKTYLESVEGFKPEDQRK